MSVARVGWLTTDIIDFVDRCIAARCTAPGTLGSDNIKRRSPPRHAPMRGVQRKPLKAEDEATA